MGMGRASLQSDLHMISPEHDKHVLVAVWYIFHWPQMWPVGVGRYMMIYDVDTQWHHEEMAY